MQNILVTGSRGYLGQPFVNRLISEGNNVAEYDAAFGLDLNKDTRLNDRLNNVDIVVNLAAMGDLYDVMDCPDLGYIANVDSAKNIGYACLEMGVPLIHISTCCVYGDQRDKGDITECSIPNPTEEYASQKLIAERLLEEFSSKGLDLTIARLGTIYGGYMRPSQVIRRFVIQNLRNEPIVIHGDGTQERTFTHINDIIDGLYTLVSNPRKNDIYNISTENHYSVNEIANIIERFTGNKFHRIYIKDRNGQIYVQPILANRMKNEYGWTSKVIFEDGIQESIQEIHKIVANENFNKSFIPCLHRLYSNGDKSPNPAHILQIKLSFSIDIDDLKERLTSYLANLSEEPTEKILITFDDGYRDVLKLEPFFDQYPIFQPVIFYTTALLEGEPLWFDQFYHGLSKADSVTLANIAEKYNLPLEETIDPIKFAKNQIKAELRDSVPEDQTRILSQLFKDYSGFDFDNLYLKKKDLRKLIKKGWIVGSHGHFHYNYTLADEQSLIAELNNSLIQILDLGGRAWLAYPDGRWSYLVKKIALDVGFKELFTLKETSRISADSDHCYRFLFGYNHN